MPVVFAVALAGAAGASARYGLDLLFKRDAHHIPWVTIGINVSGSFALGVLVAVLDAHPHPAVRPAITIGFLGAYTTFSTLSLETYRLIVRGHVGLAGTYAVGSLAAGLAAVTAGVAVGRAV
ncbi:MAG: CrcB family protein [Gaiellaceae bacterium]